MIAESHVIQDSRADLARSGIGVAVRLGAPVPDVRSVEAFTRALIRARSIAYLKEGQSGVYVSGLLERLGVADGIRPKLALPETDIVSELVSRGEIELGIVVITQILTRPAWCSRGRCRRRSSLTSRSQGESAPGRLLSAPQGTSCHC